MTSEELYNLCEPHIGKPWWANGLSVTEHGQHGGDGDYGPMSIVDAEAMILGYAITWLVQRGHSPWLDKCYCTTDDGRLSGDSTLAAVLAACAAVEGGGE